MRKKLPKALERKLLVANKHCCCICQHDGIYKEVLIHHIDGDNSNNRTGNLAVLCLQHASMADAGLKKGKLGSGRKLTPAEVRDYKRHWERKVGVTRKISRGRFPLYQKKHLEILYEFDIGRVKNEILSLGDRDRRLRDKFEYLDQLVLEEFLSGLKLRRLLLDAYSDIAFQSVDTTNTAKFLSKGILGLFIHLVGPDEVQMDSGDKRLLLEALEVLGTSASFAAEFNPNVAVLKNACTAFSDFSQIAVWYRSKEIKGRILKELRKMKKACALYEPQKGSSQINQARRRRTQLVEQTIKKLKSLEF
jgi:hypothetical protein